MAKSTRGKKQANDKAARKSRSMRGGGKSRYALKHKGGGNTGPNGMWIKVEGSSA